MMAAFGCRKYEKQSLASAAVSLKADIRLDDRGSISNRGKQFFILAVSFRVQTYSRIQPASNEMGTGDPFPGVK
jgi:hypothetical protein